MGLTHLLKANHMINYVSELGHYISANWDEEGLSPGVELKEQNECKPVSLFKWTRSRIVISVVYQELTGSIHTHTINPLITPLDKQLYLRKCRMFQSDELECFQQQIAFCLFAQF